MIRKENQSKRHGLMIKRHVLANENHGMCKRKICSSTSLPHKVVLIIMD
jgi:hypothetical protein